MGVSARPLRTGLCPAGLRPGPSSPPRGRAAHWRGCSQHRASSVPPTPRPTGAAHRHLLLSSSGAGGRSMRHAPANSRPGCRLLRALTPRPACSRALSSPPAGQPPPRPPQPSILLTSKSGCSGSRQPCSCPFSSLLAPFFQGTWGVLRARLLLSPVARAGAAGHLGVTARLCPPWTVSPASRNGMHWGGCGAVGGSSPPGSPWTLPRERDEGWLRLLCHGAGGELSGILLWLWEGVGVWSHL